MRLALFFCVFLVGLSRAAIAQPADMASLPMDQCTFTQVIAILKFEPVQRSGLIAEQTLPILKTMETYATKFKKIGVPLKDQLTSDEQIEFTRLTQQVQAGMLAQLIESKRGRDLRVFEQFVRLSDQDYRFGPRLPKETDQDYIPYAVLGVVRENISEPELTQPSRDRCSMEFALHRLMEPALEQLGQYKQIDEGYAFLTNTMRKYNLQNPDLSKFNKADAELFVRWRQYVDAAFKHRNFILDMERLKVMMRAADLYSRSETQDLTFAAGDVKKVGTTIRHMMDHNQIDERMKTALSIWFAVNEKIPTEPH